MGRFSSGQFSIAVCDRCGQQYKLRQLRKEELTGIYACPECYEPKHPQLELGRRPVIDPQSVRNPRADNTYAVGGGLSSGSRVIEWGWAPVGGANAYVSPYTPNALVTVASVGTVTVS